MPKCLRDVAEVHYGKSPAEVLHEDGRVPVIGTGGIYGRAVRGLFTGPAVVVPRKGTLGNPQYINESFWPVDTTYAVMPKRGVDGRWLYYCLDMFDLTKLNEATGVPSISRDWLYKVSIRDFDYPAQQRIAHILSTVDEAIEQTEALIAKTQQVKAGLMHDLFTRGVMPDGKLRPSREEAPHLYMESPLGWIPKEWELRKCEDLCTNIIDCKNRTPPAFEEGYPVIRTPNIRNGEFVWNDLLYTNYSSYIEWTMRGKPQASDIVITREAPVGEVCMIPAELHAPCLGQRIMLYRPSTNEIIDRYFLHALQSQRVQKHLDLISGGSTVGHVRVGEIRSLPIPWARHSEQKIIAAMLDSIGYRLRSLSDEAEKLRKIKAGLMQDLLSGRVRVAPKTTNSVRVAN